MRAKSLVAVCLALVSIPRGGAAQSCREILDEVTLCQRCYHEVRHDSLKGRVYLYAPDIRSGFFGSGYAPFTLWLVQGVYGRPFLKTSGSLSEGNFAKIRGSQNVIAASVLVDRATENTVKTVGLGNDQYLVTIVQVHTSWGGTDRVTVRVCSK